MKFTFKCEHFNNDTVELITGEVTLPDVLQEFKHFLLGCGYCINGDIIVYEDVLEKHESMEDYE